MNHCSFLFVSLKSNILVHEVHSGGAAARDGRLQVGDRLLAVNGIDLREATQKDATKVFCFVLMTSFYQ